MAKRIKKYRKIQNDATGTYHEEIHIIEGDDIEPDETTEEANRLSEEMKIPNIDEAFSGFDSVMNKFDGLMDEFGNFMDRMFSSKKSKFHKENKKS